MSSGADSKQEEEERKKDEYFPKIGRDQPWRRIYQNFCRVIRGESSKMLISFMAFLHSEHAAQTGKKAAEKKKCTKQFSVMNTKISESDICLSCRSPAAVAIVKVKEALICSSGLRSGFLLASHTHFLTCTSTD